MNEVTPEIAAKFLEKNPKIKEAWEKAGWKPPINNEES